MEKLLGAQGTNATSSTSQVEYKIRRYVKLVEGTFSHYIYVVKKDRLDVLEESLWKFFVLLFGEEVKKRCSVVVFDADKDWVQYNIGQLKACFEGCESFLPAEFPAICKNDEELELEYKKLRTESLLQLKEDLASLNRYDTFCKYGRSAKVTIRINSRMTGKIAT